MNAYDVRRELKGLYAPRNRTWERVEVPPQRFLAVDGEGDPNTAPAYTAAVQAVYTVTYTLKFAAKRAGGRDFKVGPLEALWWAEDYAAFTGRDKDAWRWTVMIALPEWVEEQAWAEAAGAPRQEKGNPAHCPGPALHLDEGLCAQALHIGPYDAEGPLLAELHQRWLPENGLRESGLHHEVYLNDPRRSAPERLKTVLRQPAVPIG
jgi:hypothetical protein